MIDLNVVHIATCLIIITLIIGISHNELGLKYTTALSSANYSSSSCLKTVLMVNVPKSDLCCHESSSSWLCYATLDKTTKFLIKWPSAIIIPFAPFILNTAVQILWTITKCVCLGLTSESCRTHMTALFPTFKRGLFYLGVVLFRMFALYLFPMKLQDWLLHSTSIGSSGAEQNLDCWCRHLVSVKKCRDEFDFSDHIVLFTVQYILPLALEAEASLSLMKTLLLKRFQLATNVAMVLHFVAFLVSCGVIALNLKAIYFTCVYFHTPLESIVGFCIAFLFAFLPLNIGIIRIKHHP